jgi:hypothetical protein
MGIFSRPQIHASHVTLEEYRSTARNRSSPETPLPFPEIANRMEEDCECSICLQPFCAPSQLPCKHVFCRLCLEKIQTEVCPICMKRFNWWRVKDAKLNDEKMLKVETQCSECSSQFTIGDSLKHNCREWIVEVSHPVIKCEECQFYGHWLDRTCAECKQRMHTVTEWKTCEAKILLWNQGSPHVMLDKSFCPSWGAGCTASLRLFLLHKDGTMSSFAPLEEKTWYEDFDRQSDGMCEYEEVWTNWSRWKELWSRQEKPTPDEWKAVLTWRVPNKKEA